MCSGCPVCFFAPPGVLLKIAERGDAAQRDAALRTLATSTAMRAQRAVIASAARRLNVNPAEFSFLGPQTTEHQTVYDVHHGGDFQLPGQVARTDDDAPVADAAVNEAFDGSHTTYAFYKDVFDRDSLDAHGLSLISTVHFGTDYDNALWNGSQMIYGDGGGGMFVRGSLTKAIDVIGHELTHGITQFTAGLAYHRQSGALNESFSDVFGSLVKQHSLRQSAADASWLVGEHMLDPSIEGVAVRSMKEPGSAFEFDDQPAHMKDYLDLPDDDDPHNDHGGVHLNSGIPNRAFYLAATAIGGNAWEKPGLIWYTTLTGQLKPDSDFKAAADATVEVAGKLYGDGGSEQSAVQKAWQTVGVL
ncbi:MAG: hypothetical protein QOG15_3145 [Solirubrobacteraceae bacterium]|nr:hypothetical protein [Solirubrobacteraceae bacterium]